ncbi:MAG: hypothetical protein IPJ65_13945 [Archangiaceae bacterium]|nr:hypothetical protein [Archangiaceae bacterium]
MKRSLLAALLAACAGSGEGAPEPGAGSLDDFVALAQPVLEGRCANPSCHGNAARPLSLYAVHRFRLEPGALWLDAPLSERELRHNFRQASVFVEGASEPERVRLLLKPLSARAGGGGHAGVEVFAERDDYGYRALLAWVEAAFEGGGR